MNLGINAWHAMKQKPGPLRIALEAVSVGAVYAATKPCLHVGDYVRVSVSDTGTGIDPLTLRKIFEPFFTTKAPGEGTGLGLSVVHGIMDGHDGAVTVHSQLGEGTVFRLYFPIVADAMTLVPENQGAPPRGNGEKILLVDDEELVARVVQRSLNGIGYDVEFTTRPIEVLNKVRAEPKRYALVITDQSMPGMSGLTLASELQKIAADLPLVLMTGNSLSLTAERVEAMGFRQLLLKPPTLFSLGAAVYAALHSRPKA
jgi:CheY-like chemotaxis protein